MPFVSAEHTLDTASSLLKASNVLSSDCNNWNWPNNDEHDTDRLLIKVSETLRKLSIPNRTLTCQLAKFSGQQLRLQHSGSTVKYDAVFALVSPSITKVPEDLFFSDETAVTAEYTPHTTDALKLLVSGAMYTMNVDASRKYMFGIRRSRGPLQCVVVPVQVPGIFDSPPSRLVAAPRAFPPEYHYRVVFNEVGEALHDVDDISSVLAAAQSCIFALQFLFLAGWVRRDIITGSLA
ncbi:hypothetical protein BD626DRAFT_569141 [Schizophyllum amplum]|uniref:Uncharacterized protein n=1 Tax=Schizophyllum amplum TaxID=97359 RepID=A0A550CE50_9AGAR|nr:hypothetical protein BD626DRAFT_569141 [Auriculariopsis ampla]